jgi:hypothetical protein
MLSMFAASLRTTAAAGLAAWALGLHAEPWPQIETPVGARVQTVAGEVVLNGRLARVFRFEVQGSEKELLAFFRDQFGARKVVENRVTRDPVIATRQGDHFITVQLHPLDSSRMQGTVMTTLLASKPLSNPVSADTRRMLPPDTRVVSTMQSDEAGRRSVMLVAVNENSVSVNRDHVLQAMAQRGFRLLREDAPRERQDRSLSLVLSSPTEDAEVTIADAGRFRSLLINRTKDAR